MRKKTVMKAVILTATILALTGCNSSTGANTTTEPVTTTSSVETFTEETTTTIIYVHAQSHTLIRSIYYIRPVTERTAVLSLIQNSLTVRSTLPTMVKMVV